MTETNTDDKAREAVAASFLEIETALGADPKFNELVEMTLETVMDIAERHNVPPVLVVQCIFNRSAKATKDL
ncbi:MAG: hypothetical protein QMC36_06310 [Patescibacteria group bacterium]